MVQDNIQTDNQLMAFSDSSCQYFPDTGIVIGAYTIFYQVGTIDPVTHIPWPVTQSSA